MQLLTMTMFISILNIYAFNKNSFLEFYMQYRFFSLGNWMCYSLAGERAIRECIDQGRAIADKCSGPERSAILQLCDELDDLTNEIAEMMRRGMVRINYMHSWNMKCQFITCDN